MIAAPMIGNRQNPNSAKHGGYGGFNSRDIFYSKVQINVVGPWSLAIVVRDDISIHGHEEETGVVDATEGDLAVDTDEAHDNERE